MGGVERRREGGEERRKEGRRRVGRKSSRRDRTKGRIKGFETREEEGLGCGFMTAVFISKFVS